MDHFDVFSIVILLYTGNINIWSPSSFYKYLVIKYTPVYLIMKQNIEYGLNLSLNQHAYNKEKIKMIDSPV